MLLLAAVPVQAANGKALVNGFRGDTVSSNNYAFNYLEISNISSSTVMVKVTFYDQFGNIITDDGGASTGNITSTDPGTNYTDRLADVTASFGLAAHHTTFVKINSPSPDLQHGYGLIEWTSDSRDQIALMAYGGCINYNTQMNISWQVPHFINGGMPF